MTAILSLAKAHNLRVIEDNAQAFGAEHSGRKTGSMGDVGCLSFFPSKNLGGCGDGGMVVTNDARIAERVRMLRTHGWKKKYFPEMIGYNSRLDEIQVIYSSSASVYGDALFTPMTEDHPFNNRTMYGATKIAGEQFFRSSYEQHKLNYVSLRYMNGPRVDYKGTYVSVIMKVLDRIDQGQPPIIFGDGTQAYDLDGDDNDNENHFEPVERRENAEQRLVRHESENAANRILGVLWHCYLSLEQSTQLEVAAVLGVSDSLVTDYRRRIEQELRALSFSEVEEARRFESALRERVQTLVFDAEEEEKFPV